MFRILIPCLIWLSTVRSDAGMHMDMPNESLMDKISDTSMLKPKRESLHQPCGPIYPHVPAYAPPPVYVKPYVQPTYLKKELGVQPLAHFQYPQHSSYTSVVSKPIVSYVKPVTPVVNYQTVHQSLQYIKPAMPIYQKPMPSYAPIYQKPLYYAPTYQNHMYHDVMPNIFVKKYEAPVAPIVYQKPLVHAPVQYAAPKVVQLPTPHVSYVKPVVHTPPLYAPPPVHNSVIVKPHCV
ncbi:repetitive proline-rich cell wall protein-like [Odontomachus brunneus]|uniref:repetitive proline-rich cell wall protein-like n=1 Tax=Odontomachus brunneus TaxID=486640 RepID=UPI0013F22F77|nr:repetitive proline-rich cell wall protein-like [Odontomachus brunneus]